MLTNNEAQQVDKYIGEVLSPRYGDYDEIDDYIVVCSCNENFLKMSKGLASNYINKLTETITSEFQTYQGATLSLIAAQERLYQLKILLNKIEGKSSLHELALLCIASSVDLQWLEQQNNQNVDSLNTLFL